MSKATNYKAKITALGCYTPPGVLTNQDLERMVETSNQFAIGMADAYNVRMQHSASKKQGSNAGR